MLDHLVEYFMKKYKTDDKLVASIYFSKLKHLTCNLYVKYSNEVPLIILFMLAIDIKYNPEWFLLFIYTNFPC